MTTVIQLPVVRIATAADAAYLPFLAAMLSSLATHRDPAASRIIATVLHSGDISRQQQSRVQDSTPGVDLDWQVVTPELYARHGVRLGGLISRPAYFRCVLPGLLGESAGRVLYVDADTLVLGDLTGLFRTDLEGLPVGAVLDWLPTVREAIGPWKQLGLAPDAPYFNSGVMLIDAQRWLAEDAGGRALRRCLEDEAHLAAQGRWWQHDQYGLNVVFHQRWLPLKPRYNHFSELPARDPLIVHMAGNGKPWLGTCRPEFAEAFHATVDRTYWSGWRSPR